MCLELKFCYLHANTFITDMHKENGNCNSLIEKTAGALDENVITLMLLAVQMDNIELSIKVAVKRKVHFNRRCKSLC